MVLSRWNDMGSLEMLSDGFNLKIIIDYFSESLFIFLSNDDYPTR